MPVGKLKTLIHLSQQRHLPGTRLVPDHNDKGYGFIEDAEGREVFFAHDVVKNRFGFDDLRMGQLLEYTLENGPYLRASSVRIEAQARAASERKQMSTVRDHLGKQANELMHDLQKMRDAGADPAGEGLDQMPETEVDYIEQASDNALHNNRNLQQLVRTLPISSVLIAAGASALLGVLWTIRRK